MKKFHLLLAALAIYGSYSMAAMAGKDISASMDVIASSYRIVLKTDSPQEFKQALITMKIAALQAQKGRPPKLQNEKMDSANMKDYRYGLSVLIGQIDNAAQLADAGQLQQAQQIARDFENTKKVYHRKYK